MAVYRLLTWPGGEAIEAPLHEIFQVRRLAGEWFKYCATLREFVRQARIMGAGRLPKYTESDAVVPAPGLFECVPGGAGGPGSAR